MSDSVTVMRARPSLTPLSERACSFKKGAIYAHYSGKRYKIMGVGRHSETLEEYVVYQALYGEGGIWLRPLPMFCQMVFIDGKEVPRFTHVPE